MLFRSRFEAIPSDVFDNLLSRQKSIRDIVFNLMRDLPDYIEYDLYYDFIDGLTQINEEINDSNLGQLINQIDNNAEDKGLSTVKLALSYISEFYQIERGIIRHRRAEIENTDVKRQLVDIPYVMAGADTGFFEENCYNEVINYVESYYQYSDNCESNEFGKKLISAVSSSPYALLDLLKSSKGVIRNRSEERRVG